MPGRRDHLQLVGGRRFWVRPQPRMQVATQAIFAGPQDHRVFAMTPEATGRGYGHIAVRVGRILVYLEDRQALEAWTTAIAKGRRPGRRSLRTGPTNRPDPATRRQQVATARAAPGAPSSRRGPRSLQEQQMTVSDLPVEGLQARPVHPTTSSTQPALQRPTETRSAPRGMSGRPWREPRSLRARPTAERS